MRKSKLCSTVVIVQVPKPLHSSSNNNNNNNLSRRNQERRPSCLQMMHVDKWRSPRLYTSKFRSRPSDSNQNLCLRGPKRETSHVTLRIKLSVRQDAAMTNRLLKPMWPRNFNNILTSSSKLFHHRPLLWKTKRIAVQSSLKSTQHNNNSTLWARRVKIRKPKISSILNNSTKTLRNYWIVNSRTVRPNYRFLTRCWLSIRCY